MNKIPFKVAITVCLIAASIVGCGPETIAIVAVATKVAAVTGTIAGTVWMLKSIENVSLDTQKKKLEIRAMQDGIHESHQVDLTDAQVLEIQQTGTVLIGDKYYPVR